MYFFALDIAARAASTDRISSAAMTGVILAIVAVLVIAVLSILLWYRKQKRKLLFYKHQYFLKTGEYMVSYRTILVLIIDK